MNGSTSSGTLLPSAHILSSSREEETFANVAGFKEWQEKETQRYSVLKARSRSASEWACLFFRYLPYSYF